MAAAGLISATVRRVPAAATGLAPVQRLPWLGHEGKKR